MDEPMPTPTPQMSDLPENLPASEVAARGCPACEPFIMPTSPREGDENFSADVDHGASLELDGAFIPDVMEACTGPNGWAVRVCLPVRRCSCGADDFERFLHFSDGYTGTRLVLAAEKPAEEPVASDA